MLALGSGLVIATYRAIGTFGVALPEGLRGQEPGALVSVERVGKYPRFAAQRILNSVDLPEVIALQRGITLYRVRYRTTNHDGSSVIASGLVALPNTGAVDDIVVYLHGTNAERRTAPSQSGWGEGLLIAVATAGKGHALVAPDYLGLGESRGLHPYMHARTTATTVIDLLLASNRLIEHLRGNCPTKLYLTGFSQGGHATFAVQRELEQMKEPQFQVMAAAPIAGPFHLREISFPQALTGTSSSHAFYLAYLANSYAAIYKQPLDTLLTMPYAEQVPGLFDGDQQTEDISAALPNNPRDLFNAEFLDSYDRGESHWFLDALAANNVSEWTPRAPVRIYFGEQDLDVLPEEARRAEAAMRERGAEIQAISVGPYGHDASVYHAIPRALRWFEELAAGRGGASSNEDTRDHETAE